MRVLSLGAGVQSSTVLAMMVAGDLERADHVIFADTGWEPPAVYTHLQLLEGMAADAGMPFHRVTAGDLRSEALGQGKRRHARSLPVFMKGDGVQGMLNRQCTHDFKVAPIHRLVRALLKASGEKVATIVMGISVDEVERMRDPRVRYLRHDYPLVWAGMSRAGCQAYLEAAGIDAPRSACIGCPFHNDDEWRAIRERPAEWADAVAFDAQLRAAAPGWGWASLPYLHRQRVPLDQVDLSTPEDHGQLGLGEWASECQGYCGV